ncbi:helix-turn-helix domain-containing protein [Aeromonas enteropelogenes]|uniref:helix-turn-helix domain-containing protein n=1 Tax=Aeromonas enteropelogenes TaxID=29489 RepID=UPI003BA3C342
MSYQVQEIVSQKRTENGSASADWHRADVIAGLKKKGTSMSALSRANGLASTTLSNALRFPWPKGERIIATALGLEPSDIWPSRYPQLQQVG